MKKHIKTFLLCSALGMSFTGSISAEAADTDFVIKDNVLVSYTGEGGQVTVPNGVETIGEKAFYMNDSITEIILPDSVTTIEEWAFADSGISVIELPDNITTINALTFYNCDKLVSVKLDDIKSTN